MAITNTFTQNNYFSSYIDIKAISTPSNPSSGIGRIFHRSSDNKLCFKKSDGIVVELGGGAGTVTTASNVGSGSGWFKTLNGTTLEFKSLVAGTNQLSITSNTNDLTVDVVEANIKLDDLGTPDDNTDLNASTTRHGLLPKLNNDATYYMDGTGNWSVPAGAGAGGGTLGGSSTQSGNASTTVFTIAHGFGTNPNAVSVEASSIDALGDYQVDHDATNITITYQSAPPSGTNNLTWIWMANVGGAGEANTASNSGNAGVGIWARKTGVDLEFKNINAGSNKITIFDDTTNDEIDIDVVQGNLTLSSIGGSVTKAQTPATTVHTDQANSFGLFNQIFRSGTLAITNPANTFIYQFVGSALAATRQITLPLLTGNDTMVTEAFSQTLSNKTIPAPLFSTYTDMTAMSAPSNPSANTGRFFIEAIDANNDGLYCHIKKNGSFVKLLVF